MERFDSAPMARRSARTEKFNELLGKYMKWRVFLLRDQGHRRKQIDVKNGPSAEGELSIVAMAPAAAPAYRMAALTTSDGQRADLLPVLYDPQLAALSGEVLILRGFEKCDGYRGSFSVLQEWRCEAVWKLGRRE